MTDRERYQATFSALRPMEERAAVRRRGKCRGRQRAAVVCVAVLLACLTAAYAADVCGLRRQINVWFGTERRQGQIEQRADGSYVVHLDGEEKPFAVYTEQAQAGEMSNSGEEPVEPSQTPAAPDGAGSEK